MLLAFLVALPSTVAAALTAVFVVLIVVLFLGYGGARVQVRDGELVAGRAHVPLSFVADPVALDAAATRAAVGPDADARAYLLLRPYIRTAVRVRITDPADSTPYWLMSTRRPGALVAALLASPHVSGSAPRAD